MNRRQWEALKASTRGHTPGPWRVSNYDGYIHAEKVLVFECFTDSDADSNLCAAAPDLLAEVERLRAWIEHIREKTPWDIMTRDRSLDALDGAEVPE